ncbi:thiosulfate/3-mercaptopyruvate sulfurtransferase [Roseiarcus fermentans]|uniref:Thiosulfate/3-mercaptopyruvate sulfurtransferase n=1 Tax=Roseiarcus fermentans TaxID=1473586 RepID=A0A366F1P8_9HYPH|nr:3-mercaptopyruvate sulfurtransferase [Roseiarcus fermentans]RBP08561.1 thiosulfate/3-mercaptopyruvate sulfurtransferase [Roseiarcus fermentans]
MSMRNFCTTAELAADLGKPDLGIVDGSWHLPNSGRRGAIEFPLGHIPGAVYFDIDTIADSDSGLPHMLPKPDLLAREMTALGLGDGMRFVVYDALGLFAAARVWWTLRAYGAADVRILVGGLTQWIVEGRPLETGEAHPTPRTFTPRLDDKVVASLDEVKAALASGSAQVVDARPADRFRGETAEPRPGLRSGHMPGSLNLPFSEVVEHGRLKAPEALAAIFAAHGVDLARPIITTCGSGVSAAILALAVEEAGGRIEGLYDGSWAEWGGREDCPVATGAA